MKASRVDYVPYEKDDDPVAQAPHSLRAWLKQVDEVGELRVINGVDWEESIGRISEMLHHTDDSPAVLFDEIPGYKAGNRVLVNSLTARARLAVSLDLPADTGTFELMDAWERMVDEVEPQPMPEVDAGPILENVLEGDEIDLFKFPTPLWHPEDGGRYIGTGCAVATKDPDSDWVNFGTYRVMIHDEKRAGLYMSPSKHGMAHRNTYFERSEPMPVVVLAGLSPLQFVASALEIPHGVNEMEWVGGVVGSPVEMIRGRHTGLPIPAHAEIAIEGFLHPQNVELEGPFGEWTGYYASASRDEPVLDVAAIYHRNDPILLGCPPEKPPYEAQRFQQYLRSANLRRQLRGAGIPNVVAAWTHAAGGCRLFNVVAIEQAHAGHARQTLHAAASMSQAAYLGRIVIVVDEDIDVTDLDEVIWAVTTRMDPARDVDIIERMLTGALDPAIEPGKKVHNSRLLIDATRPWEWKDRFPPPIGPSPEIKRQTREDWGWILKG
jgi:4-hydroxy-3-polyprenylbenzoate decarboxylase